MQVFDAATDVIKQGGRRRGANMGILRVDHPDILDFITCKERDDALNNFNISVGITNAFMQAVQQDTEYALINPRTKVEVRRLQARKVFDLIITMAWKNGEPGIIFIDRINEKNPTPEVGQIESTNPCGEQPLLPYESCNLGSINLSHMLRGEQGKSDIDWGKLERVVNTATHFLDNVIDESTYPLQQITDMVHANRKIGLGVMGFADMLVRLGVPYDSDEAIRLADKVMAFVQEKAMIASEQLAKERGTFPNWEKSIFKQQNRKVRNATVTTIAPTGSISVIAGCSSGIEPLFAISYIRKTPQFELLEVNPIFEEMAKDRGFHSEALMRKIAKQGHVQSMEEIPSDVQRLFVTALDIAPEWHVRMQAAFQKHVDNAVSKTVNFPSAATTEDVEKVYMLAWHLGCKGVTVYRDGSREEQVLNIDRDKQDKRDVPKHQEEVKSEPQIVDEVEAATMVTVSSEFSGGCTTCTI
jgi:ribonucleoside-diphosphate reductase alpha chain